MDMIRQSNLWGCGAASLAMLLDKSEEEIYKELGHDGSRICWPDELNPSHRHIGFAVQELIDVALKHGIALVEINCPANVDSKGDRPEPVYGDNDSRLSKYMQDNKGLIFGCYAVDRPHMVAWDGERVYDPSDGRIYEFDQEAGISQITIESFYMAVGIKSSLG